MIRLETERLVISDHSGSDIASLHRLLSDPKAMHYLPDIGTKNLEESLLNLITAIEEIGAENRKKYFFKIEDRNNLEYIGEIGFTVRLDTPQGKVVNLGYFILPEYWGKGIISEAVKEIIRFAFEELNVVRIETGCIGENKASEKVMIKAGMIKEAEHRMHSYHDGKFKDRVEYSLLRDDWLQQNNKVST